MTTHDQPSRQPAFRLLMLAAALLARSSAVAVSADESDVRPRLELRPGEKYFRFDGRPVFVLGRNPAGVNPQAYRDHFRHAAEAGERLMRIHFTYSPPGEKPGEIDAGMLRAWDEILDAAEQYELAVLPVMDVWANWNDGSHGELWHRWDKNSMNAVGGGPASRPQELFEDGLCRKLWLQRLQTFVKHWSHRRAIVAWETFSELDLVTGATEDRAVEFAEQAAAVVRAADPWKRPVTASQAGVNDWPKLTASNALDFIEVHPYASGKFGGRLDELILSSVRSRLEKYGKPVLIGECGLDFRPPRRTFDAAPRAEIGVRHAIWASVVSGSANGRMLWWQDGYDQFEKADLCRHFQQAAAAAATFVAGIDFSDFAPVSCELSAALKGAAVGNATTRLVWVRDAQCIPPDWPLRPLSGQQVTLRVVGDSWQVEFFDPATGSSAGKNRIAADDQRLRIALPEFRGSIAIRLRQSPQRP